MVSHGGEPPPEAEGAGAGAEPEEQPDRIGPEAVAAARALLAEVHDRTHAIRRRHFQTTPTAYGQTIDDLVEAIEALAEAVALEYPPGALSVPQSDETPGPGS